jgi:hypothetical protein
MYRLTIVCLLALLSIPLIRSEAFAQSCAANPIAVQILGSGGPRANPFRSSSSYLLWIDGQARILVDMGGGLRRRDPLLILSLVTEAPGPDYVGENVDPRIDVQPALLLDRRLRPELLG